MTTSAKKGIYRSPTGVELEIAPESAQPVSVDELVARRDAWYEENKHLLKGYSVAEYLKEKHKNVALGLE